MQGWSPLFSTRTGLALLTYWPEMLARVVLIACKAVVFLVGAMAFYLSLFLKESQEGSLQNRIEGWWIAVDDRQKYTRNRATALFNKVGETVTHAFDRILGPKLVSVQMIGVSSSYALAGFFLTAGSLFAAFLYLLRALPSQPANLPSNIGASLSLLSAFCLAVGLVLFIIAALPSVLPSRFSRILSLIPALIYTLGLVQLMRRHLPYRQNLALLAALLISTLIDIGLLILVRQSVRWISEEVHLLKVGLVVLAQIATVVLIVWAPIEMSGYLAVKYGWKLFPELLIAIGVFNVFTGIAASAFMLTLLAVLLHRVFWPVIEKVFYPIARYKIMRNHKAMAALGAACWAAAFPSLRGVSAAILGWLIAVFSGEAGR